MPNPITLELACKVELVIQRRHNFTVKSIESVGNDAYIINASSVTGYNVTPFTITTLCDAPYKETWDEREQRVIYAWETALDEILASYEPPKPRSIRNPRICSICGQKMKYKATELRAGHDANDPDGWGKGDGNVGPFLVFACNEGHEVLQFTTIYD